MIVSRVQGPGVGPDSGSGSPESGPRWWEPGGDSAGPRWWASAPPPRVPRLRVPIPGVADWPTRAAATLLEVSMVGGICTAYQYALYFGRPVFAAVEAGAWLMGVHLKPLFVFFSWALGAAFLVWQWSVRGATGQSVGQRLLSIVTVDEDTGRPIGPARSVLRSVLHVVDAVPFFFGYFRPVVHDRGQTWADQICHTVVVRMETINRIAASRAER